MATIGRKMAVVDLPKLKFSGTLAWFIWLFVHLMSIVGVKNRLFIFINWASSYFSRDQSLRIIIKPFQKT
jgi:NADH dehydrogenase